MYGGFATTGTGTRSYIANLAVTCNNNNPSNCYCRTGSGAHSGGYVGNVCCSSRGMSETFQLNTSGIPDHFAVVVPPGSR
jgi:hypothetical protein